MKMCLYNQKWFFYTEYQKNKMASDDYSTPLAKVAGLSDSKAFDESESGFIKKFGGSYSLILIEDAGEVVKDLMHEKLVEMLRLISKGENYNIITIE